ncbi:hypothetical protein [Larkinella ripae]
MALFLPVNVTVSTCAITAQGNRTEKKYYKPACLAGFVFSGGLESKRPANAGGDGAGNGLKDEIRGIL